MYLIVLTQLKIAVTKRIMDHANVKLGKCGMKIIQIHKEGAILSVKAMSCNLVQ
jgi:hypothetical protein